MPFTFHLKNGSGASAGSTTATVVLTGVSVGDLIVVAAKWESGVASAGTATCSDGTSSLTKWAPGELSAIANIDPRLVMFYLLSSVATGTVTYTVTFSGSMSFRDVIAMAYAPPSAASLDGTPVGAGAASGTAISSGNITTTGTDGVAFGSYAEFGSSASAMNINGVAADQTQVAAGTANSQLWSKTYSGGYTGAATATISFSNSWLCGVIAFKAAGGAAAQVPYQPGYFNAPAGAY